MDLFDFQAEKASAGMKPLAERMRPAHLLEFVGQEHVIGEGKIIRRAIEQDKLFSMILWGPPGCGKTTIARIIANETRSCFVQISAVLSGVRQIREVIEKAGEQQRMHRRRTVLFVDEIHRFNKAQQDAFLQHVESGLITLIGATTENPSFEVIPALLSRCRVITLKPLSESRIAEILQRAVADEKRGFGDLNLSLDPEACKHLAAVADGDVRAALNGLEISVSFGVEESGSRLKGGAARRISLDVVERALQRKALRYDKNGEEHYNLISALHKSMRGSDPDAAVYWLARMLAGGEDPFYILRRMIRFASEDVGNADPYALTIALDALEAFRVLGRPEGDLAIAQAAIYLATAPKSNRVYRAYGKAVEAVEKTGTLPVPLHLRNAPTGLMREMGYGRGYKYAHDYRNAVVDQQHLPDLLKNEQYYHPSDQGYENAIRKRMEKRRERAKKS